MIRLQLNRLLSPWIVVIAAIACSEGEANPNNSNPGEVGSGGDDTAGLSGFGASGGVAGNTVELSGSGGYTGLAGNTAGASGGAGGAEDAGQAPEIDEIPLEEGTLVILTPRPEDKQNLETMQSKLEALETLTPQEFSARYPITFSDFSGYDPDTVLGMDTIQSSDLALNGVELGMLSEKGFVITERIIYPNFVYGYETLYMEDLPLFVSADSILHALHQSYDSLLRNIELGVLIPSLNDLLTRMRHALPALELVGVSEQARVDVDFYLAIAQSLLFGRPQPPVAGADAQEIADFLALVESEQGWIERDIFGVKRIFDFSQFTVRGHYTSSTMLSQYFRAMMWLGRIDFRLIETLPTGKQVFYRRQLEAAVVLSELVDDTARQQWERIDRTVGTFIGEHDSMTLPEVKSLLADLGVATISDLGSLSDQQIAQTIIDKGYGAQRICSHIMVNACETGTLPLNRSFLLFGQRYVVDSHVFSNVVWDRVKYHGPFPARGMPDPLDAAFGALGNNLAGVLLQPELVKYDYAPDLASMRELVDEHGDQYWQANLYNLWVDALRRLSPGSEVSDPSAVGLPSVAGTEAWGRRVLNTQLGSWAELRHDTLLYAKQSYTTAGVICEYPDAYVEPYPQFFAALVRFAEHGLQLLTDLALPLRNETQIVSAYFDRLRGAASILQAMAEHQRTGAPHAPEHIAFINRAVRTEHAGGGCGSAANADAVDASGWYADLFLEVADRVAYDPNIADVHTQPTLVPPADGTIVGYILHVGTGMPRLMVVVADTCTGPRAYAGLATSYFEQITENFDRLTDERWADQLDQATPEDVPWMTDLVAR